MAAATIEREKPDSSISFGEQDSAEGGDGGEEDYAVTAVGGQHQQGQSSECDEHGHRGGSPG